MLEEAVDRHCRLPAQSRRRHNIKLKEEGAHPLNKPIQRIAIVGTGVIGASWSALYLARGLDVIATDPAPNAEANLRHYIETAWKELSVSGLSPKASPEHLDFTLDLK